VLHIYDISRLRVKRKIEAFWLYNICLGKEITVTYSKYHVFSLSYPARRAHVYHYLVICGLSGFTKVFPQCLLKYVHFGKKLLNKKHILIFSTTRV